MLPAGKSFMPPHRSKGGWGFGVSKGSVEQPQCGLMRRFCARAENSQEGTIMAKNRGRLRPTVRDPVEILVEIANDPEAPATARVAAAKALLLANKGAQPAEDA